MTNIYTLLAILTDPLSLLLIVGMGGALIGLLVAHWLEVEPDDEPAIVHGEVVRVPEDYATVRARFNNEEHGNDVY